MAMLKTLARKGSARDISAYLERETDWRDQVGCRRAGPNFQNFTSRPLPGRPGRGLPLAQKKFCPILARSEYGTINLLII